MCHLNEMPKSVATLKAVRMGDSPCYITLVLEVHRNYKMFELCMTVFHVIKLDTVGQIVELQVFAQPERECTPEQTAAEALIRGYVEALNNLQLWGLGPPAQSPGGGEGDRGGWRINWGGDTKRNR